MKKIALLFSIPFLLSIAVAPVAAQEFRIKADIPFAFTMNGTVLQPGTYEISAQTVAPDIILFQTAEGRHGTAALSTPLSPKNETEATEPKLEFDHNGNRYFLTAVWMGNDDNGYRVNMTRAERKAAGEDAAARPESVVVAATR
jgi:hypothetical protein